MLIIASSTTSELCEDIANKTGWELIYPLLKTFNDGETYLKLPDRNYEDVLIVYSLYYPQDSNLFQLLNLISTVKRLGANLITVYTPYFCYARSDREILVGEAISSNTVITLLESVGVDHLLTLDVHNPEILKYSNVMKTTNIYPTKGFADFFLSQNITFEDMAVVAPDYGAVNRAKVLASELNLPYYNLIKQRDPMTGDINVQISDATISTKRAILVDDITSTGSSLVEAANLLSIYGVEIIHFYVTHVIKSEAIGRLKEITNGIIVSSNSVPSIISKISSAADLLEALNY